MELYMNIVFICMLLLVVFVPGYTAVVEAYKGTHPDEDVSLTVRLKGLIPFYRTLYLYEIFYSYKSALIIVLHVAVVPIVILRVLAIFAFPENMTFMLITTVLDMVAVCIIWFVGSFVYFDVARMIECKPFIWVLCFIIPPAGCYIVARNIVPYLKQSKDIVDNTFLDA